MGTVFLLAFLATAPVAVFATTPATPAFVRVQVLFLAALLGYGLLNASLHAGRAQERRVYEACWREFDSVEENLGRGCEPLNIGDGAANIFYLWLGWFPASAYVGVCEAAWRVRHRRAIRAAGPAMRGRWAGALFIGAALLMVALIALFVGVTVWRAA